MNRALTLAHFLKKNYTLIMYKQVIPVGEIMLQKKMNLSTIFFALALGANFANFASQKKHLKVPILMKIF